MSATFARRRWHLLGMVFPPLIAMTVYLLWLWPRPSGSSFVAQTGPYILSLLTGVPFAWSLARGGSRVFQLLAYLVAGFVILGVYAVAILCGVRGVCL